MSCTDSPTAIELMTAGLSESDTSITLSPRVPSAKNAVRPSFES